MKSLKANSSLNVMSDKHYFHFSEKVHVFCSTLDNSILY